MIDLIQTRNRIYFLILWGFFNVILLILLMPLWIWFNVIILLLWLIGYIIFEFQITKQEKVKQEEKFNNNSNKRGIERRLKKSGI